MPERITYYLGAGASFHSIPTVKDLHTRMKVFMKSVLENVDYSEYDEYESIMEINYALIEDFKKFGTPDTLARNYFLTDDQEKYEQLKKLLSCYLIFEQLPKPARDVEAILDVLPFEDLGYQSNEVEKVQQGMLSSITSDLDQRYNSFFATILDKPDKGLQFPKNVNIISWNYDCQLERGFQDFYFGCKNLFEAQDELNVIPRIEIEHPENWRREEPILSDFKSSSIDECMGIIGDMMFSESRINCNRLQFAWEDQSAIQLARGYAHKVMSEAEVVVVIGYSFPDFNRRIDKQVFRDFKGRLYIQDPHAANIAQKIRGVNQNIKLSDIVTMTDTKNFFIPYEFWEE